MAEDFGRVGKHCRNSSGCNGFSVTAAYLPRCLQFKASEIVVLYLSQYRTHLAGESEGVRKNRIDRPP